VARQNELVIAGPLCDQYAGKPLHYLLMDGPKLSTETIVAISTPPGRGGIGIVRLTGPDAASIAAQLVKLRQPLEHGRARLADVLDGTDSDAGQIDEALVTFFGAPRSYTSEDLVEIAAHGSPVVLELLLRRALELRPRLVEPGDST
jgi:tRNA modification GTPase